MLFLCFCERDVHVFCLFTYFYILPLPAAICCLYVSHSVLAACLWRMTFLNKQQRLQCEHFFWTWRMHYTLPALPTCHFPPHSAFSISPVHAADRTHAMPKPTPSHPHPSRTLKSDGGVEEWRGTFSCPLLFTLYTLLLTSLIYLYTLHPLHL